MKLQQVILHTSLAILGIMTAFSVQGQYYYNDIVLNKELLNEMARLKEQRIRTVNVMSLEGGIPTEGFYCQKKINKNYTEVELKTSTSTSYPNVFISYFSPEGLLKRTTDSSEVAVTTTIYNYDERQQLAKIVSTTDFAADDYTDKGAEEHIYQYDQNGQLQKMQLVKNITDTTVILFMPDENNNIAIEKNTKTGEIYYYYYDSKKHLTDIVHTYNLSGKLIPDYKFEYNGQGLVTQMIASEKEGAYFFTWKYSYDNGLRMMERCYTKEGRLTGSIEYEYK